MTSSKHIISVQQFDQERIASLFKRADVMRRIDRRDAREILRGSIMMAIFYEASTRTRFSFESAMIRLGGSVITTENAREFSSAQKGEKLSDSIRVLSCYGDVIVLRHFDKGSTKIAALYSSVPVISGGDGPGEHPTQALLDLYTIFLERGNPSAQHVVFVGDLRYGRTVHSLARLLAMYKTRMSFVSPEILALPEELRTELGELILGEYRSLADVINHADVIYMTRVQKERFSNPDAVAFNGQDYALTFELVNFMEEHTIVLHPLPRNEEIPDWFDNDPSAAYFRQAQNGLYVRMAILEELLNPFHK